MHFQVPYDLQLTSCGSKHLALYQAIRDSIVTGALASGEKLPSTRQLAASYGLSRGSVSVAYEMLAAEGYIRSAVGQGTFVASAEGISFDQRPLSSTDSGVFSAQPVLSAWGHRLMENTVSRGPVKARQDLKCIHPIASFIPRGIGERIFPWMSWRAAVSAEWKRMGPLEREEHDTTEGSLELRRTLATRLRRERGIVCQAENIVVTGGSMQAIALLTQLLLNEEEAAVVEDPCYPGTREAILACGGKLIASPVDHQGIVPDDWEARMLFVTPTRQFPTGAVLGYERRLALLRWAAVRNAWIIEDDYDSEFRFGGRPVEPLKSLDQAGRVIYVGSFSRSMRSEVRIGYAVLPDSLRTAFVCAKRLYDPYPEGIAEQRALAAWMADGEYDRHLRRARRVFHKLHNRLHSELVRQLSGGFEVHPADAGLSLFAVWTGDSNDYDRLHQACKEAGVSWKDGAYYEASPTKGRRTGLFGFAHLDEEQIANGIRVIRECATKLGIHWQERGKTEDA